MRYSIIALDLLRLGCCVGLVAVTALSLPRSGLGARHGGLSPAIQLVYYATCTCAASFRLVPQPRLAKQMTTWTLVGLLLLPVIYETIRNVYLLSFFGGTALDVDQGSVMWTRLGMLFISGIIVPLFIPAEGTTKDGKTESNPRQLASVFSKMTFSYLSPLIYSAWKAKDLTPSDLPEISEEDTTRYLTEQYMIRLDPVERRKQGLPDRHLFWGIASIFWLEAIEICVILAIKTVAELARPLALNRLLVYLQLRDESDGATRPFVWVALLFVAPAVTALTWQRFMYISSRVPVRLKALLTELVFRHTLRVRLTATAGNDAQPEANLIGKLQNLVSSDIDKVIGGRNFFVMFVTGPIQTVLAILFMYKLISWSAFVGLAILLAGTPLSTLIVRSMNDIETGLTKSTDARMSIVTEAINGLRAIKMFAWGSHIKERINIKRNEELKYVKRRRMIWVYNTAVSDAVPIAVMAASFASYTLLEKQPLTSAIVYSTYAVLGSIQWVMNMIFHQMREFVSARVALGRLDDFLQNSELLDEYMDALHTVAFKDEPLSSSIGFTNASFAWSGSKDTSPKEQDFRLQNLSLTFIEGRINVVVGATASGKTALLLALLGEMKLEEGSVSLPRSGGIAYVPQDPWLNNASIRDNILLCHPYDRERMQQVIMACSLEKDLATFANGDLEEVGEKGLTLSGGQKMRLSLARAVYSPASTIIADDCLSALDSHTAKWIVDRCLAGPLMKGRTLIIATHHSALLSANTAYCVRLNHGKAAVEESKTGGAEAHLDDVDHTKDQAVDITNDKESFKDAEAPEAQNSVLVVDEEKSTGRVSKAAWLMLLREMGWFRLSAYFGFSLISSGIQTAAIWWLGFWAKKYDENSQGVMPTWAYVLLYGSLVAAGIATGVTSHWIYASASANASLALHQTMLSHILKTTFRWLDTTPIGRILTRFSSDMSVVDGSLVETLGEWVGLTVALLITFSGIVLFVPAFSVAGLLVAAIGALATELYLACQLPLQRETSNARSPLLSTLNSSLSDAISIRAYNCQDWIDARNVALFDALTRCLNTLNDLQCWISIQMDLLGAVLYAVLGAYLVYGPHRYQPSTSGFVLNLAMVFASEILWWVRLGNDASVEANSIERIHAYTIIPQEIIPSTARSIPASWPTSGKVTVRDLTAKYSENGKNVLNGLSFDIASGTKLAVVGRTGAGKSSLALALLRLLPTEGVVLIDGIDTKLVDPDVLRSKITIIPQDPMMLAGDVRSNLDPFNQYDDATLNDSLRASGIDALQKTEDGQTSTKVTLDTQLSANGSNLSQGQRQMIALARALTIRASVIIMDEATSGIDLATDELIQRTLRKETEGVTAIVIAHRLSTVVKYDKVLVMDAGKAVEYGSPEELVANGGVFAGMLQAAGL